MLRELERLRIPIACIAGTSAGSLIGGFYAKGVSLDAMQAASLADRVAGQKLILEHEMGEFFKVIGLTVGSYWDAMGFARGDRTHRL